MQLLQFQSARGVSRHLTMTNNCQTFLMPLPYLSGDNDFSVFCVLGFGDVVA